MIALGLEEQASHEPVCKSMISSISVARVSRITATRVAAPGGLHVAQMLGRHLAPLAGEFQQTVRNIAQSDALLDRFIFNHYD
jgi:hypothetical protein